MKSISVFFIVFSLLLVVNLSYARKDLGDYWKNMMNGQPMPEAIKNLIQVPKASEEGKDHFIRDFDVKPNVILYHTHLVSNKQKQEEEEKAFDSLKKQQVMVEPVHQQLMSSLFNFH